MQHSTREKALFAFVVASLIFCVFVFLATTKTVVNVSALDTSHGVGVYEDSDCSDIMEEIPWGTLYPGSVKNKEVYIRNNNKTEPMYLIMWTKNWDPLNASDFLELTWNYTMTVLAPEDVIAVKLTLSVSPDIKGISRFSFDILIAGSDRLPGDVNDDGRVSVADLVEVDVALESQPGDPNWNPYADVDGDGRVSVADLVEVDVALGS